MSDANEDVKFTLKVMMNKQKTKVVFAEVDSTFADVLLSFLTLPLGRIVRILKNHYGDEAAPAFGSLTTLYNGLEHLDSVRFWTQGAKSILLHPRSSSEAECKSLKLDISDSPPLEWFVCEKCSVRYFDIVSVYHDNIGQCKSCNSKMKKEPKKCPQIGDGVLTICSASFLISDNLQMIVSNTGLLQTLSIVGTTDIDNIAQLNNVSFGVAEVMDLLKASLVSSTPLSDVILKKIGQMNSATRENGFIGNNASASNSKKMNLKVIVQKSTNKLLYAEAEEDFIEFLFGLLIIPLGGVESLLSRNSSIKAIDNLYTSVADKIDYKYFKNRDAKERLIEPKIPYGYVSGNYILPLTQQSLTYGYNEYCYWNTSISFPKGKGKYISGPQTYKVEDDLTVTPFCFVSIISCLNELKIATSDVKEVQLQIGLEEGLSILKASLTSTSALTDALLKKQLKQEQA